MGTIPHVGRRWGPATLAAMTASSRALESLLVALAPGYEGRPVPRAAWQRFAQRQLDPQETVLFALQGWNFGFVEPLVLVTDRRTVLFRDVVSTGLRRVRGIPAPEVAGVQLAEHLLWATLTIRSRSGRRIRVRASEAAPARRVRDGVEALLGRGR